MHHTTMVELHALKIKLRAKGEELSQSQNELKRTREELLKCSGEVKQLEEVRLTVAHSPVSYTHLRAHETGRNLVCRLLLEKK